MNANNPMTPGVYTVEKSAFPNSVAQVPTAIPAFIGYTEIAIKQGKPITEPLMVNSMAEFEQYFGGAPTNMYPINEVTPTPNLVTHQKEIPPYDFEVAGDYYKVGEPATGNSFYLYYSMQLFYQNGGGPCYIMSIGNYEIETQAPGSSVWTSSSNTPDKDHFLTGLAELPKIQFPKPTMILAPDALLLSSANYYTVQEQILAQCGALEDRVALMDIYNGYQGLEDGVIPNFRNSIGNNNMSYGIAYYPFLETTIVETKDVTYANIDQTSAGASKLSAIFIGESALASLSQITDDLNSAQNLTATPPLDFTTIAAKLPTAVKDADVSYPSWKIAFNAFPSADEPVAILKWQLGVLFYMVYTIYELGQTDKLTIPDVTIGNSEMKTIIKGMTSPTGNLIGQLATLYAYDLNFVVKTPAVGPLDVITKANLAFLGITPDIFKTIPKLNNPTNPYKQTTPPQTEGELFNVASQAISKAFTVLNNAMGQIAGAAQILLNQYNTSLEGSNANYKTLMAAVALKAGTLPASPAMAGMYTLVDNTEGVWTSPANRNINSVIAPTVTINNEEQASLNVDALAGKSINAIRAFFGVGPAIVWGARTLDGNSLDWKYISIRRTMIMIEQSVANAAFSLVFQANDASTWNNCEAMIANFLHNLWSEGALQGSTPAAAYNVEVGLGKTMTPLDILNGIMRVQVKVALVHPAEFIIITYEQELATS